MIVPWREILATFPLLLALLLLFYTTGRLLFRVMNAGRNSRAPSFSIDDIFHSLFTGFFLVISLYAILSTGLKTCLLPVPFVLIYLVRLRGPWKSSLDEHQPRLLFAGRMAILYCFAAFFIYWLVHCLHFVSLDADIVNYITYDTAYYGRAGSYLNFSGTENTSLDYLGFDHSTVEPYHFGDLWFIAFTEKISGLNAIVITHTVVYPFFIGMCIIGLACYLNSYFVRMRRRWPYYILLAGGSMAGVLLMFPWAFSKLFFVGCLIVSIALALRKENYPEAILLTTLGCLSYITVAVVLAITILICLGIAVSKRSVRVKELVPALITSFVSAGWLVYFYSSFYISSVPSDPLQFTPFSPKKLIEILLDGGVRLGICIPFMLLIWFSIRVGGKIPRKPLQIPGELFFLVILPVTGLGMWAIFHSVSYESVQFFQNIIAPLTWLVMVCGIFFALVSLTKVLQASAIVLALTMVIFFRDDIHNRASIQKNDMDITRSFLEKYSDSYFVNLRALNEYNSIFTRNTVYEQPLVYLDYLMGTYVNISLNTPDLMRVPVAEHSAEDRKTLKSSPFVLFSQARSSDAGTKNNMYDFVKEKNIRFLSASRNAIIPELLRKMIRDSITIEEGRWKIYYLLSDDKSHP